MRNKVKVNVIAVDDEKHALKGLSSAIEEALPDGTLSCFSSAKTALEYARGNRVDMAFLDIEMAGMNGLRLAKCLKDIYSKTYVVFVTGHPHYAVDAFALRAGGYIMKPVTAQAVIEEVEYLRNALMTVSAQDPSGASPPGIRLPEHASPETEKRLRVQTFGNFEVFLNGKPLVFGRSKTKELFAYLVSRQGALCNNNEIVAIIWEDKDDSSTLQSMFRALVADLTRTLNAAGMGDILFKKRGYIGIAKEKISCDLYDFCAGIKVNSYFGEFMTQYSWAEFTNMYLDRIQGKNNNYAG